MICIYKLTSPSNKCYIGQTTQFEKRIRAYINLKCKEQPKLYFALKKYSFNNFKVDFLWQTEDDTNVIEILNELERDFIYLYDSITNGYNLKEGGKNGRLSEETRKKISDKSKLRKHTDETKDLLSKNRIGELNPFFGKNHTIETKKQISELNKGKIVSSETRNKMSLYQQNMPEEHKLNISKSLKGLKKHPLSDETRDKISKSLLDRVVSDETRNKMSESSKGKQKSNSMKSKLSKQVMQYDLNMNEIRKWKSLSEASLELSISVSSISLCCHSIINKAGGYKWLFI